MSPVLSGPGPCPLGSMMCRNNNKVYCSVGQCSHSVPFSPSRAQRADELESQNRSECIRSSAITRSSRGCQSCVVTRIRDWIGETVGKLWQRFSTLIVFVTAWCRATAAFVAFMQLTFVFSMYYGLFAKSVVAPSPKPLAG